MSDIKLINDFTQGDTFKVKISHNPTKNITGYSFILVLVDREGSDTPILEVSHSVGDDVNDIPADGVAWISVTATDTNAVPQGKYFGSIKRINAQGEVTTLLRTNKDGVGFVTCYSNLDT